MLPTTVHYVVLSNADKMSANIMGCKLVFLCAELTKASLLVALWLRDGLVYIFTVKFTVHVCVQL